MKHLKYKADWNNKQIVKIDRFYPSSKTCHHCGYIHKTLQLSERIWVCGNRHVLDRDLNASKNILLEGLKTIGAELSDYTGGGSHKIAAKKHESMKPEAQPISFAVDG